MTGGSGSAAPPPLPLELEAQNSSDTEAILRKLMEHLASIREQKTVLVSGTRYTAVLCMKWHFYYCVIIAPFWILR